MKSQLRYRPIVLVCLMASISAAAHASDASSTTDSPSGWGKFKNLFKKHATVQPAPVAATPVAPPAAPVTKLLRYDVSFGDKEDCSTLAASIAKALSDNAVSNQVTLVSDPKTKCTSRAVSYEKGTYEVAQLEVTYDYTLQGRWKGPAPELNKDVVGGMPNQGKSDGHFGLYPTYQSCLDAAAGLKPDFGKQTGAEAVAFSCQPASFGFVKLTDEQLADMPTTLKTTRVPNYSLTFYSAGKQTQQMQVFENQRGAYGDMESPRQELAIVLDLLAKAGVTVTYPTSAEANDGRYIAYYSNLGLSIQIAKAGRTATLKECTDQTGTAEKIWAALGATGATAFCQQLYQEEQTLEVISLGYNYIQADAGNNDLIYPTYDECMNSDEQATVMKARSSSQLQGVMCFPDQFSGRGYRAQLYRR